MFGPSLSSVSLIGPSRGCFSHTQKPLIPVTVQDQIRLWELEKNRVKSDEGTALISVDQIVRNPTPALSLSRTIYVVCEFFFCVERAELTPAF